jgi:hypothetical protein
VSDWSSGVDAGRAPLAGARLAGAYVACYVLWLATAALGLLDVVALRQLVEWTYAALHLDKWGLAAASHGATIVFGVTWLAVTMYAEHAYREGVARRALWGRFARLTLVEAVPLVVALLVIMFRQASAQ